MITPAWTAPNTVSALSTTRQGGVSVAPFDSFNVGLHVGDDEQAVLANRALLTTQLPNPAVWLHQTHSSDVVVIDEQSDLSQVRSADALYTRLIKQPLAIMTADCLPVLLCSSSGDEVAAVHGGWRGLAQGILANTVSHFRDIHFSGGNSTFWGREFGKSGGILWKRSSIWHVHNSGHV